MGRKKHGIALQRLVQRRAPREAARANPKACYFVVEITTGSLHF